MIRAEQDNLNLVLPGAGVDSPGGVALIDNDLHGLAALGQQPSSTDSFSKMMCCYQIN